MMRSWFPNMAWFPCILSTTNFVYFINHQKSVPGLLRKFVHFIHPDLYPLPLKGGRSACFLWVFFTNFIFWAYVFEKYNFQLYQNTSVTLRKKNLGRLILYKESWKPFSNSRPSFSCFLKTSKARRSVSKARSCVSKQALGRV